MVPVHVSKKQNLHFRFTVWTSLLDLLEIFKVKALGGEFDTRFAAASNPVTPSRSLAEHIILFLTHHFQIDQTDQYPYWSPTNFHLCRKQNKTAKRKKKHQSVQEQ